MSDPHSRLTLDAPRLRRLADLYGLPDSGFRYWVVALRGAQPQGRPAWARSSSFRLEKPDYRHMRCAIGLWDRESDRILWTPGSTVPHRDQVVWSAGRSPRQRGKGTNQLEPGYYEDLAKGEHLQGKPRGHAALRQTAARFYRRAHHPPPYTGKDPLYWGNPYDNLHCAWNERAIEPGYRSSGCLVVAGWPFTPRLPEAGENRGPWKAFHDAVYTAKVDRFPLWLLPAIEAKRALQDGKPRRTFGSGGVGVRDLQARLRKEGRYRGPLHGRLDTRTYRAWKSP